MSSGLNWARATERDQVRRPAPRPERPITEKQAAFLKSLQEQLGEPYIGDELSSAAATLAIDDALRRLKGGRKKRSPRRSATPVDARTAAWAKVSCPRKGCGAQWAEPCRDRSGMPRAPHACRLRKGNDANDEWKRAA